MQKVGELLNKHEIAIDVFNKVGSIAKTADFVAAGLKNYDVVSFCNQGEYSASSEPLCPLERATHSAW